ncbi:hypothetical protein HHJ65_08330 [Mobiluncus curtisii]|nr:hypothetical protein [Mobiluncus curtisii]
MSFRSAGELAPSGVSFAEGFLRLEVLELVRELDADSFFVAADFFRPWLSDSAVAPLPLPCLERELRAGFSSAGAAGAKLDRSGAWKSKLAAGRATPALGALAADNACEAEKVGLESFTALLAEELTFWKVSSFVSLAAETRVRARAAPELREVFLATVLASDSVVLFTIKLLQRPASNLPVYLVISHHQTVESLERDGINRTNETVRLRPQKVPSRRLGLLKTFLSLSDILSYRENFAQKKTSAQVRNVQVGKILG